MVSFPKSNHIAMKSLMVIFLVDGGWSEWYNKTNCTEPCGGGVAIRQRTCTKPSPSCGGRECVGPNVTNISCRCCPGIVNVKI